MNISYSNIDKSRKLLSKIQGKSNKYINRIFAKKIKIENDLYGIHVIGNYFYEIKISLKPFN